jgi:hypothetical protein
MVQVREKSRFGPCYALGELIGETDSIQTRASGEARGAEDRIAAR